MYPIERQLRCLAKAEGSYVVSVLDCCRERIERQPAMRGKNDSASKGSFENNEDHEWIGMP